MKKISAWSETITISEADYTIVVIETEKDYDCYIQDENHPLLYMFGLPKGQQSAQEAMDIAIANAPDFLEEIHDI